MVCICKNESKKIANFELENLTIDRHRLQPMAANLDNTTVGINFVRCFTGCGKKVAP